METGPISLVTNGVSVSVLLGLAVFVGCFFGPLFAIVVHVCLYVLVFLNSFTSFLFKFLIPSDLVTELSLAESRVMKARVFIESCQCIVSGVVKSLSSPDGEAEGGAG